MNKLSIILAAGLVTFSVIGKAQAQNRGSCNNFAQFRGIEGLLTANDATPDGPTPLAFIAGVQLNRKVNSGGQGEQAVFTSPPLS